MVRCKQELDGSPGSSGKAVNSGVLELPLLAGFGGRLFLFAYFKAKRHSRNHEHQKRDRAFYVHGRRLLSELPPPSRSCLRAYHRNPLNQSAAALSGSYAPTFRFENLEIRKGFLRFPNLNLEQNPLLTALAIESELPWHTVAHVRLHVAFAVLRDAVALGGEFLRLYHGLARTEAR